MYIILENFSSHQIIVIIFSIRKKRQTMTAPKEEAKQIIDALPEDTTYDEIL
jgi:hypothetical protein